VMEEPLYLRITREIERRIQPHIDERCKVRSLSWKAGIGLGILNTLFALFTWYTKWYAFGLFLAQVVSLNLLVPRCPHREGWGKYNLKRRALILIMPILILVSSIFSPSQPDDVSYPPLTALTLLLIVINWVVFVEAWLIGAAESSIEWLYQEFVYVVPLALVQPSQRILTAALEVLREHMPLSEKEEVDDDRRGLLEMLQDFAQAELDSAETRTLFWGVIAGLISLNIRVGDYIPQGVWQWLQATGIDKALPLGFLLLVVLGFATITRNVYLNTALLQAIAQLRYEWKL